jgi:lysophospholipase L1-like esterase
MTPFATFRSSCLTLLLTTLCPVAAAAQLADCPDATALRLEVDRQKARLDDWPQRRRYADANAKLAPPAAGEPRVVFLGDSITDAWDDPRYGGFFPGKPYVNRGIGGQTTPQMVLRMRADVIALQPKALVLLAGTNDLAGNNGPTTIEQIEDNLATIAELAAGHGIKVVLASVLPVSAYHYAERPSLRGPQTSLRQSDRLLRLNTWLKAYAAEHGHVYLDYWPGVADASGRLKAEFSSDDLHPNAAGYAAMAPLAEAAIARALAP